jgi:vesicle transport through interaction with t-SNAREs protein 1
MDHAAAKDRFFRYEENFLNCSRGCSSAIENLSRADGNVDRIIATSVEVEGELSEAESYVRAMDVEHRNIMGQDKRTFVDKVRNYRDELKDMNHRYNKVKFAAESEALKKGSSSSRTKLLNANTKLDKSTDTLHQSRALVGETEEIGTAILTDLKEQKETLRGAEDNVIETRGFTLEARRILKRMRDRAFWNKACIYIWIVVLFIAIMCVIIFGFAGVTVTSAPTQSPTIAPSQPPSRRLR